MSQAGLEVDSTLPRGIAGTFYQDTNSFVLIKAFPNRYEYFCAVTNVGAINVEYTHPVHCGRAIHAYYKYDSFLEMAGAQILLASVH